MTHTAFAQTKNKLKKGHIIPEDEVKLNNITILLVEDDKDARTLLRHMLNRLGITEIYDAQSGRDAQMFLETSYEMVDMVLCDWVIPGINGFDLLKRIRSIDPELPFIMVTGLNDVESINSAKEAGVSGYIAKPINFDKLKKIIVEVAQEIQSALSPKMM